MRSQVSNSRDAISEFKLTNPEKNYLITEHVRKDDRESIADKVAKSFLGLSKNQKKPDDTEILKYLRASDNTLVFWPPNAVLSLFPPSE